MVDITSRRIVNILESHEMDDVSNWLLEYPNIQLVSRDGSQTYASAITKAHPKACQISDRFYILKNLNDAAILHFQKLFKGRISIPITPKTAEIKRNILSTPTPREKILLVKKLHSEAKSKSEIKCIINASERTIKKYINMKDEDIPIDRQVVRGNQHEDAVKKVLSKVDLVKSILNEKEYSIYKICKETGFTKSTVKQYLSPDFNPINANYGNRRKGLLSPYRAEIIHLRSEHKIYGQFAVVIETYPMAKNIYHAVSSFKKIVLSKNVEELSLWMNKTEALAIDEINSFINGLKRDIIAVKNAITLEYNNGLAEGSVNKLKVIKQIMYGRNRFDLLRNKVLMLEALKIN